MLQYKKSLLACVIVSMLAIFSVPFVNHHYPPIWSSLCFLLSLFGLCGFYLILKHEKKLDSEHVDWVYYFGFLITLFSLAAAAADIGWLSFQGRLGEISNEPLRVIIAFAGGLLATGFSLILRLLLIHEQNSRGGSLPQQIADTEEQALRYTQGLVDKLKSLTGAIESLAKRAESSSRLVVDAATGLQAHLQQQTQSSTAFQQQQLDNLSAANQAFQQHLDALKRGSDAWHEQIATGIAQQLSGFVEATLAALRDTQQANSADYTSAVQQLCAQLQTLQTDLANIEFETTAQRIERFADSVQSSLGDAAEAASLASIEASDGIAALHKTLQQVQQLSANLAEHLHGIHGIEALVRHIHAASDGLQQLGGSAGNSQQSLTALGRSAQEASDSLAQNLTQPAHTSQFAQQTAQASSTLANINQDLAQLNASFAELRGQLAQHGSSLQTGIGAADSGITQLNAILANFQPLENLAQTLPDTDRQLQSLLANSQNSATALHQLTQRLDNASGSLDNRLTQTLDSAALENALQNLTGKLLQFGQSLDKAQQQILQVSNNLPALASYPQHAPPGAARRFASRLYVIFCKTPISELPRELFGKADATPSQKPPRPRP